MKKSSMPSQMKSASVARPRRGEIWWVRLDPTLGAEIRKTRPCLVVTTNVVNDYRRTVVVVPLSSSTGANPPLLVPLKCQGKSTIAVIDQIRAVTRERLLQRIEAVSSAQLDAVEDGLRAVLEL